MADDFEQRVTAFVTEVTHAMGLSLEVTLERTPDGLRVGLGGPDGEVLVRRRGEALEALQLVVSTVFRRDRNDLAHRVVVDCLDFRRDRDNEIRQMTRFLIEKVKTTGVPQEIGPLNSYARRIVHLEVAENQGVTSESQGDGLLKNVLIARE